MTAIKKAPVKKTKVGDIELDEREQFLSFLTGADTYFEAPNMFTSYAKGMIYPRFEISNQHKHIDLLLEDLTSVFNWVIPGCVTRKQLQDMTAVSPPSPNPLTSHQRNYVALTKPGIRTTIPEGIVGEDALRGYMFRSKVWASRMFMYMSHFLVWKRDTVRKTHPVTSSATINFTWKPSRWDMDVSVGPAFNVVRNNYPDIPVEYLAEFCLRLMLLRHHFATILAHNGENNPWKGLRVFSDLTREWYKKCAQNSWDAVSFETFVKTLPFEVVSEFKDFKGLKVYREVNDFAFTFTHW